MINRIVLVGRLTKDPELRYTPNGIAVARFTLAVNRTFSNQQGERQADFINCVVWRKMAENTANYLKKGSLAGVEGRIQTGSFEGQDGKRVYTTEVVADSVQFLEPRGAAENRQGGQQYNEPTYGGGGNYSNNDYSQGNYQAPAYQTNQQSYSRVDEDPFAPNNNGRVDVTEDDLPF